MGPALGEGGPVYEARYFGCLFSLALARLSSLGAQLPRFDSGRPPHVSTTVCQAAAVGTGFVESCAGQRCAGSGVQSADGRGFEQERL